MPGYTLKLDLDRWQLDVLAQLLRNDIQRSEREGSLGTPWNVAVAEIEDMLIGYRTAVREARALDGGQ